MKAGRDIAAMIWTLSILWTVTVVLEQGTEASPWRLHGVPGGRTPVAVMLMWVALLAYHYLHLE
ncbi:MAG: hypothetical protein WCF19_02685 [Chlamydiales bacterium]